VTSPQVSVVMAVYNGERHLAAAIDSILVQTVRDIELIVVEDGSTDATRWILRTCAQRDSRVRVFNQTNTGLPTALNRAIAAARGSWIARMDDDDFASPHRLQRQLTWLHERGDDVCGSAVRVIGGPPRTWCFPLSERAIRTQLLFNTAFAHPTVVGRSSWFKRFPYDESLRVAQDYDLWVRMAAAGARMSNCPDVLLGYRLPSRGHATRKLERQHEVRDAVAARHWAASGRTMPIASTVRFTALREVSALLVAVELDRLAEDQRQIVVEACWRMAMRSGELGPALHAELRAGGIQFRRLRRLALDVVLRLAPEDREKALGFLHRFR